MDIKRVLVKRIQNIHNQSILPKVRLFDFGNFL